jgi:two-component system cell cycle response regulator
MTRMLIVEDDVPAAELTMRRLRSAGLEFSWERVENEVAFREALARAPDIILSDSQVSGFSGMTALSIARRDRPGTPFVFVSGNTNEAAVRQALEKGAAGYISKGDVEGLATTVRGALRRVPDTALTTEQRRRVTSPGDPSGIAGYLLERRAVLDRTLCQQDRSAMSSIMRRAPPTPVALLMIDSSTTRERFAKLLRNANIEIDEADTESVALARLERRTHAVMFTDRLELIRSARQLHAGAATHIVFVNRAGEEGLREALRAGANDHMPEEPRGEEFWAHLTTARRIVSLAASLQLALTDNRVLSTVDELTRCGSRRFFEQEFPREVERATRLGRPLALVMCDIDHFKRINDSHGHQIGDEVLREFAEHLGFGLRLGEDWVARIGGEEFAVVLPETSADDGRGIAERLRDRVSATRFTTSAGAVEVTASFGVCGLAGIRRDASGVAESLIKAADAALYASKDAGRNRVTTADSSG